MRGVLKSVGLAFVSLTERVDFLRQGLLFTSTIFEKLGSNWMHMAASFVTKFRKGLIWIPAFAGMTNCVAIPFCLQNNLRVGSIEKGVPYLVIPAEAGIQIKLLVVRLLESFVKKCLGMKLVGEFVMVETLRKWLLDSNLVKVIRA